MIPSTFVKQPWEERILQFDLTDAMATGDTIDTIVSVTVTLAGVDQAAMVGTTAKDSTNTKVLATIKGGTAGNVYWVRVRVQTASGDKIEDDLKLLVKQLGDA